MRLAADGTVRAAPKDAREAFTETRRRPWAHFPSSADRATAHCASRGTLEVVNLLTGARMLFRRLRALVLTVQNAANDGRRMWRRSQPPVPSSAQRHR